MMLGHLNVPKAFNVSTINVILITRLEVVQMEYFLGEKMILVLYQRGQFVRYSQWSPQVVCISPLVF